MPAPTLPAPHRHVSGIGRFGSGGRRTGPPVVSDDVGLRIVQQHGARRAGPVALPDRDRGAGERAPGPYRRDMELELAYRVGRGNEQCVRRPHGPAGKSLTRGHEGLGENLAAVDHLPAPAVTVSCEAGQGGIERFHIEDADHLLDGRLGQGKYTTSPWSCSSTPYRSVPDRSRQVVQLRRGVLEDLSDDLVGKPAEGLFQQLRSRLRPAQPCGWAPSAPNLKECTFTYSRAAAARPQPCRWPVRNRAAARPGAPSQRSSGQLSVSVDN
jgi:hypothetical protein